MSDIVDFSRVGGFSPAHFSQGVRPGSCDALGRILKTRLVFNDAKDSVDDCNLSSAMRSNLLKILMILSKFHLIDQHEC